MTDIDIVASALLEESKRFLEKAQQNSSVDDARDAYLHAALNLAFCSLEAHINAIAEDQLLRKDISLHERALLSERKIEMVDGKFQIQKGLQMYRLEDRLEFLWTRFSTNSAFDRKAPSWGRLKEGLDLRNGLTHPKSMVTLSIDSVKRTISAIIDIIDIAYMRIYKKPFPAKGKDLHSTLTF